MKFITKSPKFLSETLLGLEKSGRYEEALAELNEIWKDLSKSPEVENLEPEDAAEIILRCGSLIGFFGHNKQLPDSQETSKNLLTDARKRFLRIFNVEKVSECETYLAMAYWRTGELVEAETWIEEALARKISRESKARLYALIIKSLIYLSLGRHAANLDFFSRSEKFFLENGDAFLIGNFYSNFGISLRNFEQPHEALEKYKLAKFFFGKAGHMDYLGAVENNSAYLYKSLGNFRQAHISVDNAVKIYEEIKDKTRKGSSLDTKAVIFFEEGKLERALETIEESIRILRKGENFAYLVESMATKSRILVFSEKIAEASLCLAESVEIARMRIGAAAAENLAKEFEIAIRKKMLVSRQDSKRETETKEGESFELILPASLARYENYEAIRIKNNYLEKIGLPENSLAIIVREKVRNGDLVAISEIKSDSIVCGFYDSYFGTVSIGGIESEPFLFNEEEIKIAGKIIGVGNPSDAVNGKIRVKPVETAR